MRRVTRAQSGDNPSAPEPTSSPPRSGASAELWLALVDAARPLGLDLVWKSNGFLTPTAARRLGADLSAANIDGDHWLEP